MNCFICESEIHITNTCSGCGEIRCQHCFIDGTCSICKCKEYILTNNLESVTSEIPQEGKVSFSDIFKLIICNRNLKDYQDELIRIDDDMVVMTPNYIQSHRELINLLNAHDASCNWNDNTTLDQFQLYISRIKNVKLELLGVIIKQLEVITSLTNEISILKTQRIRVMFEIANYKTILNSIYSQFDSLKVYNS